MSSAAVSALTMLSFAEVSVEARGWLNLGFKVTILFCRPCYACAVAFGVLLVDPTELVGFLQRLVFSGLVEPGSRSAEPCEPLTGARSRHAAMPPTPRNPVVPSPPFELHRPKSCPPKRSASFASQGSSMTGFMGAMLICTGGSHATPREIGAIEAVNLFRL